MGLIDKIKSDVKKSGNNRGKFIYVPSGEKLRVRFLSDMDDGVEIVFHDSFAESLNVPCQEQFGRECPYCEQEGLRTRSLYAWPVYDYEAKEVKVFLYAVNNCSPLPALVAMYENYGTMTDRDYVISCQGKGKDKTFSVVPMDKVKFRGDKIKPYSQKAIMSMVDKTWPADEEEETPKARKKAGSTKAKVEEVEDDDEESVSIDDYEDMSPKELYALCKERELEVEPKKPSKYYITILEEADKAEEDWGDAEEEEGDIEDEDGDEWEDE